MAETPEQFPSCGCGGPACAAGPPIASAGCVRCESYSHLFSQHDAYLQAHGGDVGSGDADPDEDEAFPEVVRAKWLIDGARTLADAASRLREEADRLQGLHDAGWTLSEPVADDYGFLVSPPGR